MAICGKGSHSEVDWKGGGVCEVDRRGRGGGTYSFVLEGGGGRYDNRDLCGL